VLVTVSVETQMKRFEPCQSRTATAGSEHVWLRFKSRSGRFFKLNLTSGAFHRAAF